MMVASLHTHERGKVYRAIYNLKRSIAQLEKFTPRTPLIDAKITECKELEKQLLAAAKDPTFINKLVDSSLKKTMTVIDGFQESQKIKRDQRRTWGGLTRADIARRNEEIRKAWKVSKLTQHNFAGIQSKKYGLSITQIKKIIKHSA